MITAGCCPPDLPGCSPDEEPNEEPNETGDPCEITKPFSSSANLKSGNLHFYQDAGGLTLSYNSIDKLDGAAGKKWTHSYNQFLKTGLHASRLALHTADGNVIPFELSGYVYSPVNRSGDTSSMMKNTDGTYTRILKSGVREEYNAAGKLTAIRDQNGNTATLSYTSGNLSAITDANGRTTTLTSTSGRITRVTDALGRTHTLAYTNGLLTSITDPAGHAWTYTYDDIGRMLTKRDPLHKTTTYAYDSQGRVLSATDPEGLTRIMNYTGSTQTAFTEKDGSVWTYKYDPVLTVKTEATDPLGNTTRYTYDSRRNLTATIAHDGTTTTYTYDNQSNMTSMTDPLGNTTAYAYNSHNRVTSITDPRGGVTAYTYDAKGNPLTITDPAGATTAFQYDARGNVTAMTDARGKTTTLAYDAQNNLTSVTDPRGKVSTFTYDASGNRLSAADPLGNVTRFVYNALNQMTQVTDPKGNITRYTYDYQGNVLSVTDAKGNPTTYAYNYRGGVTQITDALNNITRMNYGPTSCGAGCGGAEKISALTDALNRTTGYAYDAAGRLLAETDPQGRTTAYGYDANGKMITKTKPDGRTITYHYDAAGRLVERRYPDNSVHRFSYDQNGNLLGATNQHIAYYYSYDGANRMTGVTDSRLLNFEYQYDPAGNRTAMTSPDGATTTYTYDNAGRLTRIGNYIGAYAFTYDNAGRRTRLTYPNGATATYLYDKNSNLTQVKHAKGILTLADRVYQYDANNNRTKQTQALSSVSYTYDAISRLTASTQNETYGYDAVGNRLAGPRSTDTHTYNEGNEQIRFNNVTYEYDVNGNRVKKIQKGGARITTYAYDDENRLIRVTQGSTTITYAYDPFGRRIEKNVGGAITQYVYDNEDILLEYDGSNNLKARYTHGPGIDEPLAVQQGNNNYYYHADGLGSIVVITNRSGQRIKTYAYDAFGNLTQSGSGTQPYTYTAREYDPETGLYYYRARYYDPKAGRFITKDPILHPANGNGKGYRGSNLAYQHGVPTFEEMQKNPQNLNPYAYARNNPINFSDPLGLACGSGKWEPYIPDNYGAWCFTSPCQNHDNCYDTCGNSKAGCDIKFYFDMLGVCARIGGALYSTGASCVSAASIYYAAVAGTSAAQKAYNDAQNAACNSCKK